MVMQCGGRPEEKRRGGDFFGRNAYVTSVQCTSLHALKLNMIFLWRANGGSSAATQRVYTGADDALESFFYFENVIMRGWDEAKKAL